MKHRSSLLASVAVLAVVAVVAIAALSACGSSSSGGGGGSSAQEIKIGALYPVTGDLAKLGEECLNGAKLAVDEINAAGGIKSMSGSTIKLVEADSQGKPDVGISEVQRLVQQDNVSAIIGTYQSSVALPATQAAERLQTPMMISMAVADAITERGYKNVFRICPKADWYAKSQIDFIKALPSIGGPTIKRVALLHEDTDFGQSTATGQKKYLKEAGLTLATEVAYPGSAADLTTQVSKIKASNPDIVLTATYLNDAILIAQAREKLGMKQLFFDAAGGTVDPEFINRLGAAADKELTEIEFTKFAGDVAKQLNDKYKAKFGSDITGNGMYGYQAIFIIAKALENSASADRAKLRDAIAAVKLVAGTDNVVMPTKEIAFSPDGQIVEAPLYIVQVQNSTLMPVFPTEVAAAKLQLP
jgi:branched-chain amino acid transport system substrate-binding protein